MIKTSIIIPVWNGHNCLADCLAALGQQTADSFEIIAVDNGSTDSSVRLITEQYPHIYLIQNAKNLGFGLACNIGLRKAKGDVLVLLNQDTVVESNWLEELVDFFATHSEVGIVGSKAYYEDGKIQHAGGYIDAQGGGYHYGHREPDRSEFNKTRDLDFVTGASLAIRRDVYEQIGDLDEGFQPAYYEDVDWCYRARIAGWRVVYLPASRLIHKEESRLAQPTHMGMYLFHRNRLRFLLKHFSIERLQTDFIPLEQEWLPRQNQQMSAAMHHAYLSQLMNLTNICNWRRRLTQKSDAADPVKNDFESLADLLTSLRTLIPYPGLAGTQVINDSSLSTTSEGQDKEKSITTDPSPQMFTLLSSPSSETMQSLQDTYVIRPHEFNLDRPIAGRLIAFVRRLWYQVAARWAVESGQHQQTQVNQLVMNAIQGLQDDINRVQDDINRVHTSFFHQFVQHHQSIAYLDHEVTRLYSETKRITAEVHHLDGKIYQLDEKYAVQMNHQYGLHQITQEYLTECGRELVDVALWQGQT